MKFKNLDTVVLRRALPEHGLQAGDVGAVVEVYSSRALEVEFVTGSGRTAALLTLKTADVRSFGDSDLITVRRSKRRSA